MQFPEPLITVSSDRLSGAPVFAGTRVPLQTFVDYLVVGDSLDDFLVDFPNVSREHAIAVHGVDSIGGGFIDSRRRED